MLNQAQEPYLINTCCQTNNDVYDYLVENAKLAPTLNELYEVLKRENRRKQRDMPHHMYCPINTKIPPSKISSMFDETENMTVEQVLKRKNEFKSVSEILKSNNKIKSGTYWALSIFENNLTYDYFLKFVPFDTESSIYIVEEDEKIIPIKVQPYRKYNDFADINPESTQEIYSISKFTLAQIQKGKHTTILSKHTDYQPRANAFPIQYWDHVKFLEWSRFNLYFQGILYF